MLNMPQAVIWYRKVADQGDADAQIELGRIYEKGIGVAQDTAEAAKWYRRAADLGDADGQTQLGVLHRNGQGVKPDDAEALKWFAKAAAQGHAEAQFQLGVMHFGGLVELATGEGKAAIVKRALRGPVTTMVPASLLQVLDTTIANVAIPHMQAALGATPDTIAWVLTSYITATAVGTPITSVRVAVDGDTHDGTAMTSLVDWMPPRAGWYLLHAVYLGDSHYVPGYDDGTNEAIEALYPGRKV